MRVGIAASNGRISPVLDVARTLVVAEADDGRELGRREERLGASGLTARAAAIAGLKLDALICGAISRPLRTALERAGVRVVALTCGSVEDVLAAYISGRWSSAAFLMPGCSPGDRILASRRRPGTKGDADASV
jgi:predicted Fe-Mo cluster-binding NifX family protein